ncbi:MAG TPA: tetratricopeptide repeat protein [Chthoniobacterales bacterium]|jgi:tetratricopeptide (TPR) repeat protein
MIIRSLLIVLLLAAAPLLRAADPNTGTSPTLERAKQEFQDGKFAEALGTLDELDKDAEPTARSLDFRGRIYMEQGQLEKAAELFNAAQAKDPNSFGRLHLGDLLMRQKKYSEAREVYRTGTKETNLLPGYERLRFGILLTYLAEKDDVGAQQALDLIKFPSESGAYYYAQAAWAFAHDQKRDGEKWIKRASEIYAPHLTAWFARWVYDFGWTKNKPTPGEQ